MAPKVDRRGPTRVSFLDISQSRDARASVFLAIETLLGRSQRLDSLVGVESTSSAHTTKALAAIGLSKDELRAVSRENIG
eukprot:1389418-Amorphochlora_amoeboformis.AAC.2